MPRLRLGIHIQYRNRTKLLSNIDSTETVKPACNYCRTAINIEAPHNGPCGVKDSIATPVDSYLCSSDLTDETLDSKTPDELITMWVQWSNHASHLRFASGRWSNDSARVYKHLQDKHGINGDEMVIG